MKRMHFGIALAAGLVAAIALMFALAPRAAAEPQTDAGNPAKAAAEAPKPAPAGATSPRGEVLESGKWSMRLPLGLQAASAYIPDGNPMSDDKILLGKNLYFDPRLSKDRTISCASCHMPFHGFTDPHRTSAGVSQKLGGRNSPTVLNRLFSSEQFWDGRAADLEAQAHGPLTNPVEMAMSSHDDVVANVKGIAGYAPLFKKAYGEDGVTMEKIAKAIASYERTVVTGNSAYDRYQAGEKDALSASAVRGLALFNGKGNCKVCHSGFNFTDETYQNIGVGMDKPKPDLGRFDQTKKDEDKGKFKTPTLRNISQTAPYMHDGSDDTLLAVVQFYNRGGIPNSNLSKEIKPLQLSSTEELDLVEFLQALTGDVNDVAPVEKLPE